MRHTITRIELLLLLVLLAGCASTTQERVDNQAAAHANAQLGLNLLRQGQYDRARQHLERALQYDSGNIDANWGLALAYQRLNRPEEARRYFKKIVDQRSTPAIYNSYAAFLCKQGETQAAIEYFKRAADDQRNANPAVALANAGLCLKRSNQQEAAIGYFRKALSINADQPTALTQMARIQFDQGQYLSARGFIERAAAEIDLSPDLLLLAARIELALGDRDTARQYLQRHNQSRPSSARTLDEL